MSKENVWKLWQYSSCSSNKRKWTLDGKLSKLRGSNKLSRAWTNNKLPLNNDWKRNE
ncbi:hypothetical protein PF003_g25801 [Phytophthora fragariae]|nr:hypothetical protein PF003_g25801 [Phytophthora fragariae]